MAALLPSETRLGILDVEPQVDGFTISGKDTQCIDHILRDMMELEFCPASLGGPERKCAGWVVDYSILVL